MKTRSIITIAAVAFLPVAGFSQAPPNPPNQPNPPNPPNPPPGSPWEQPMKKVPVTFLGVETSEVPGVVSEQLGLAKGFGLVVDYVVPDGPAATAGVQQNDIIKMLNDQILTEPDQLAKLVRSYSEGTSVTLTLVRKGKEQKVTVKLIKKEVPQRHDFGPGHHRHFGFHEQDFGDFGMNDLKEQMQHLKENLGEEQRGLIHDTVMKARKEAMAAGKQIWQAGNQLRILSRDGDAIKATQIDLGKAQIVFSDDKGEIKVETIDGRKMLTAKDPQGKLIFSGPVESKEDLDKVPAEVRQRYDKLQANDLPPVEPASDLDNENDSAGQNKEDQIDRSVTQIFSRKLNLCA